MIHKNTDIIPITYIGGTGGRFVATLLTMANQNRFEEIKLSEHGNAHDTLHIPLPISSLHTPSITLVESLLNLEIIPYYNKPYFVCGHIKELLTVMEHFKKSIRIIYDVDDISDIVMSFLGKQLIDEDGLKDNEIKKRYYEYHPLYQIWRIKHFNLTHEEVLKDRVLFITWKELCYSSPDEFINRLSTFSNIPKQQFSINNLLKWRQATMDCSDKIKLLLNTTQETNTWLIAHK